MHTVIEDMKNLAIVSGLSPDQSANVPTSTLVKPQESDRTRNTPSQNMQQDEPIMSDPNTSKMQSMVESIINDLRNLDVGSRPSSARSASTPTNGRAQPVKRAKQPKPSMAKPPGQNGPLDTVSALSNQKSPKQGRTKDPQSEMSKLPISQALGTAKKKRKPKNKGGKTTAPAEEGSKEETEAT